MVGINTFLIVIFNIFCYFDDGKAASTKYIKYGENARFPNILESHALVAIPTFCGILCSNDVDCISFNYNPVVQTCELTDNHPDVVQYLTGTYNHSSQTKVEANWVIYYKDNLVCPTSFAITFFPTTSLSMAASTNYPITYNNNENYYWLFVKPSPEKHLKLNFQFVDLEYDATCSKDRITVYGGACTGTQILAVICGNGPQEIIETRGFYVLVNFKSDGAVTGGGFTLQSSLLFFP